LKRAVSWTIPCTDSELWLEDRVAFLGGQENVSATLAGWDVLAHPSLDEGFGPSVLEAMAAGLPVVATRVGGLPELIDDRATGLLVRPGDPPGLARALHILLGNPACARAMGSAGYVRAAAHFSVDRMVAETGDLYASLSRVRPV
jgi:glycosyltransferase involved in cell wall biosynthesis